MRKAVVRSLSGVLIFVLSFTNIIYGKHIVRAADSTVKIYIGDSKTARHHFTIAKGSTSDEFSFEVKDYDVAESSYRSSNTLFSRLNLQVKVPVQSSLIRKEQGW